MKFFLHYLIQLRSTANTSGQALVGLLVFMMVGLTVISTAVSLTVANSLAAQKFQDSQLALAVAESGAENALLRLLRDPDYAGETLTVGQGTATITVTQGNPITISSVGQSGNFIRTVAVQFSYVSGILTISSWKEM